MSTPVNIVKGEMNGRAELVCKECSLNNTDLYLEEADMLVHVQRHLLGGHPVPVKIQRDLFSEAKAILVKEKEDAMEKARQDFNRRLREIKTIRAAVEKAHHAMKPKKVTP